MLEIILLVSFAKKLAAMAQERGRSKGWAALGVLFWLGGEVMGFIIGGVLGLEGMAAYPVALLVAGIGIGVAYLVVKNLPAQSLSPV